MMLSGSTRKGRDEQPGRWERREGNQKVILSRTQGGFSIVRPTKQKYIETESIKIVMNERSPSVPPRVCATWIALESLVGGRSYQGIVDGLVRVGAPLKEGVPPGVEMGETPPDIFTPRRVGIQSLALGSPEERRRRPTTSREADAKAWRTCDNRPDATGSLGRPRRPGPAPLDRRRSEPRHDRRR